MSSPSKNHSRIFHLTVVLALKACQGAKKHADDIPALIPVMGFNVMINLATSALLATGLFMG